MTNLTKKVARRVTLPRGDVVVTLAPGGIITFREKGRRKEFVLSIAEMFARAVDKAVQQERAERRAARKLRSRGVA